MCMTCFFKQQNRWKVHSCRRVAHFCDAFLRDTPEEGGVGIQEWSIHKRKDPQQSTLQPYMSPQFSPTPNKRNLRASAVTVTVRVAHFCDAFLRGRGDTGVVHSQEKRPPTEYTSTRGGKLAGTICALAGTICSGRNYLCLAGTICASQQKTIR